MFKEIVWDYKDQEDGYFKDISDDDIKLKAASDVVSYMIKNFSYSPKAIKKSNFLYTLASIWKEFWIFFLYLYKSELRYVYNTDSSFSL